MADKSTDTRVLWQEFKKTNDRGLRDRLILTYAPLVKYVAGRLGSGLPAHVDEGDLVSYGLLGLIGAIERYEPDRDVKFETYAIARIKGAIIDELRAMDWVPRSVQDGDEGGDRGRDRPPARAREARRHPVLLRGADPPRNRRGARCDRVPRLAAPHEGGPSSQGEALRLPCTCGPGAVVAGIRIPLLSRDQEDESSCQL